MSLSPDLSCSPWHAAQTPANREARAAAELAKQGFETFLLRCVRGARHARRVTKVAAPLFPGYRFVRVGVSARWRAVNGTIGVTRLVMAGDRPAPIAQGVGEGLMARRDPEGYVPLPPRAALAPGEAVRVAIGAFAEALGLFEEARDADRVTILLDLLGRKVRVLMDETRIEKAA